jgi:photosystem II stability/assembly factor-like uncharacterized protein
LEIPSVHAIQRSKEGGLTAILENLGLELPPTKKKGKEWYIDEGRKLSQRLGRIPTTREIASIAAAQTIQRNFGSISSFQGMIKEYGYIELAA